MALFTVNHGSTLMNKHMGMNVILPDKAKMLDDEGNYKVLYLLHGYTGDYTKWLRFSAIERYANETGIAVVMPDAGKSFYTDMTHGDPVFSYITEEVPAHVKKWFPITSDPACTYIAGLSMGGYGAMKIALTYPERYAGAATLSGALAMAEILKAKVPEDAADWLKRLEIDLPLVFGYDTDITETEHDLFTLVTRAKASGKKLPKLYVSCGTEDFVYPATAAFRDFLTDQKVTFVYDEGPGVHEWGFWDAQIKKFMEQIAC